MRILVSLLGASLITSCVDAGPPSECPSISDPAFAQCFDLTSEEQLREHVEACLPAVEPVRFEGTWGSDFEYDLFFAGQELTTDELWQFPEHQVSLVTQGTPLQRYREDEFATAVYVEFEGRLVPCGIFGENYDAILVDRLISSREIEHRRSAWYR